VIEKIKIYTTYAPETDMTFIMKDIAEENILVSTECIGWYHGQPEEALTTVYAGSLKAEYLIPLF